MFCHRVANPAVSKNKCTVCRHKLAKGRVSQERKARASELVHPRSYYEQRASLLGARTLLGAPGLTTRSKDVTVLGIRYKSSTHCPGTSANCVRSCIQIFRRRKAAKTRRGTKRSLAFHSYILRPSNNHYVFLKSKCPLLSPMTNICFLYCMARSFLVVINKHLVFS